MWPSYLVAVLNSPTPNLDKVEIFTHCPDFGYWKDCVPKASSLPGYSAFLETSGNNPYWGLWKPMEWI